MQLRFFPAEYISKGDTKARLERLLSSVTGNINQVSNVSLPGGGINGNAVARLPVRGPDDAQESGFYHCGGAVPDARDRGHDRDIHGGERRTPSAIAVLASRAAYPRLHRVSDVSQRRSAPVLDFRTGISGSAPGYALLGVIGRVDYRGCESCRENATGARYRGIPERRTAGNTRGGPGCRAVDNANRRCPRGAGRGRYFLWHVAKRFCR